MVLERTGAVLEALERKLDHVSSAQRALGLGACIYPPVCEATCVVSTARPQRVAGGGSQVAEWSGVVGSRALRSFVAHCQRTEAPLPAAARTRKCHCHCTQCDV